MFKLYQMKWGVFLCLVFIALGTLPRLGNLGSLTIGQILEYLIFSFIYLFACWLIHQYFILHRFKSINKKGKAILAIVTVVVTIIFINYLVSLWQPGSPLIKKNQFSTLFDWVILLTQSIFLSVFIYIIVYNIQTNIMLQKSKLENELLEQIQLRAQLLSLQQQVSPHFLFNSLSTLKTIAPDQKTKTYVIKLANVYRYLLNFNDSHLTSVKDELAFMQSYVYILQERFEDALRISIDVPEVYLDALIPPLCLQLLVENSVKHNIVSPEKPLHIRIYTDQTPSITVENSYQPKISVEESTGKGLQNIKDRYQLLAARQITVFKDEQRFIVTLPLL